MWGEAQMKAISEVKSELMKPTVLALFDTNADLKVSADVGTAGKQFLLTTSCIYLHSDVRY